MVSLDRPSDTFGFHCLIAVCRNLQLAGSAGVGQLPPAPRQDVRCCWLDPLPSILRVLTGECVVCSALRADVESGAPASSSSGAAAAAAEFYLGWFDRQLALVLSSAQWHVLNCDQALKGQWKIAGESLRCAVVPCLT